MSESLPEVLRQHAEEQHADELAALAKADDRPRPPNWRLSPWAVATYVLGGELENGTVIKNHRHRVVVVDKNDPDSFPLGVISSFDIVAEMARPQSIWQR